MIAIAVLLRRRQEHQRRRQFWLRPWIARLELFCTYDQLMTELERESRGDFKGYLRMETGHVSRDAREADRHA